MNREVTPWRESPPPGPEGEELKALLEEARQVKPWTTTERAVGWWRIAEAASAPRRHGRRLLFAGVGALAVGLAVALVFSGAFRADRNDSAAWAAERLLPDGDLLRVSPGATYSVEPLRVATADGGHERLVRLSAGKLEAQVVHRAPGDRFVVITPQVTVTVVGTRFLVEVDRNTSRVLVHEGVVRVRGASGVEVTLHQGEQVRSDDERFRALAAIPPSPMEPPPAPKPIYAAPLEIHASLPQVAKPGSVSTRCDREPATGARLACLEKLSGGSGLAAQTALYALALTEADQGMDARARWKEYQRRFPDGVFAPEVSLCLMSAQFAQGQRTEALGEAEAFLHRFPDDARARQVAAWRDAVLDAMKLSSGAGQDGP